MHPNIDSVATPIRSAIAHLIKFSINIFLGWRIYFEPMLRYKYRNIALGATPNGSASCRAPDRINPPTESTFHHGKSIKFEPTLESKYSSVASRDTPIGSTIAHPIDILKQTYEY